MEDIFKPFRDNLENRPEPPFMEQDWQDLQTRLDREKRPVAFGWWWIGLPLLFLLSGSNAFFFWQWKKASHQAPSICIIRDTIFHSRIIYTTDTIYRTRIREKVIHDENNMSAYFLSLPKGPAIHPVAKDAESLPPAQLIQVLPDTGLHLVTYDIKPLKLHFCEVYVPIKKHKKSFLQHLNTARQKAFGLGIAGGLAFPYEADVDYESGNSLGLHANLEFTNSLQMWMDATFYKTLYVSKRMGEDIGVPIESAPSNEYLFLQAEVPQPFFQYSAGMRYLLRTQKRLKPFVGMGVGLISLMPYEVSYEFRHTTLGVEWSLDKPIFQQGLVHNFLIVPAGLELGLSKHWIAAFEASYRYHWKSTGIQSPNLLGIRVGVDYRF